MDNNHFTTIDAIDAIDAVDSIQESVTNSENMGWQENLEGMSASNNPNPLECLPMFESRNDIRNLLAENDVSTRSSYIDLYNSIHSGSIDMETSNTTTTF